MDDFPSPAANFAKSDSAVPFSKYSRGISLNESRKIFTLKCFDNLSNGSPAGSVSFNNAMRFP